MNFGESELHIRSSYRFEVYCILLLNMFYISLLLLHLKIFNEKKDINTKRRAAFKKKLEMFTRLSSKNRFKQKSFSEHKFRDIEYNVYNVTSEVKLIFLRNIDTF